MSQINNAQFLTEKRSNFIKFISDIINKKSNKKYAKLTDKLEQLRALNIELFITAVIESILPYKSNPQNYIIKMLQDEGIDKDELTADELAKAARYILCFCQIVSS